MIGIPSGLFQELQWLKRLISSPFWGIDGRFMSSNCEATQKWSAFVSLELAALDRSQTNVLVIEAYHTQCKRFSQEFIMGSLSISEPGARGICY